MKRLNNKELNFIYSEELKNITEKNHKIIENKYIAIFGKKDYEEKKEQVQKDMYNHYKILNSNSKIAKLKKYKTLEQFESEKSYLHILPYVRKQIYIFFREQGIEIQNAQHFLELCNK